MKKLILTLGLISLLVAGASAQTATLTTPTTSYSASGGNVTFTATVVYPTPTSTPTVIAYSVQLPAGWKFVSQSLPAGSSASAAPVVDDNLLEWAFSAFPAAQLQYTFVVSYPAGLTGDQTIAVPVAQYRSPTTNMTVANVVLTPAPTAPAITTQPANQAVTAGSSATFSVVATGFPAPAYQWRKGGTNIGSATNASYTVAAVAAGDAGSYDVVITNSAGSVTSTAATLTVAVPPAITTQPANATVNQGQNATFTAAASGTPTPTFQWKKGATAITGATNATLTITNAQPADEATYTVDATNAVGTATSNGATLTVNTAPAITTQPTGGSVDTGGNFTFTAAASGKPTPTFQWKKGATNISGATNATLALTNVQPADAASYSVTATNSVGAATSSAAVLVVNFAPAITTQPANVTVNQGQTATFTAAASGVPAPTFQWKKDGVDVAGATNATLAIANAQPAAEGTYMVVATNTLGFAPSNPATLTVNTLPAITQQPTNQSGFENGSATFMVAATGKPAPTFQWRRGGTNISGATNATYTRTALTVAADNNTSFDVVVTNSVGAVTSTAVTLSVTLAPFAPIINAQPANTSVVQGQTATFTVGASANPTPTYQWRKGTTNITGATGASYAIPNAQPADEGTYSVVITNTQGTATSNDATLTVIIPPAITTQPAGVTVDQGQSATFTVVATGTATLTYQWKKGATNVGGATNASLTIASAQPADEGSYTVVVSNGGGNLTSTPAVLNVNTAPVITTQPANITVNQGQQAGFIVVFTAKPLPTFQWKKDGTDITGATSPGLTIPNAQPADEGGYTVVLTNSVGTATSTPAATLTVNTPPTYTTQPANTTANQGTDATFTVVVAGKPTPTLQWRKGATVLANDAKYAGVTTATLTVKSVQPADNGAFHVVATNSVVPAGLPSTAATLLVHTAPVITTQPTAAPSYLVGANVSLGVVANGVPAPTFQWRKGGTVISGATNPTLALTNVQIADRGSYDVVVTNSVSAVTSNAVTLVIYQPPAITTQPANQTAVAGTTATFTVVATGDPAPTYQWRRNGLNIPNASGATFTLNNVPFDAGGAYRVVVTNPGGTILSDPVTLTVNPVAPSISLPAALVAIVGRPFQFAVGAGTNQATFSATGLPAGLTINTVTGVITGIPTTATGGTPASVSITATNVTGTDTKTLNLAIQPPPPVITSAASTNGRVGTAFTFAVAATNTPTSYAATGLPPGLAINATTGAITGTPTQAGTFNVAVSAANATGGITSPLFIGIAPPLNVPAFTGGTNLSGVQGATFLFTPAFANGPFTNFSATGLPAGLAISATTGAITGAATATGAFTVNITATNAGGSTTVAFTLTINPAAAAPVITSASTAAATVGTAFTFQLTSTGTPPASSYEATNLPAAGLALTAATGVISGTPTAPTTIRAQVRAANTVGNGPPSVLVITVNPAANAPVITSAPVVQGRVGDALTYTVAATNTPTAFAVTSGTLPAGLGLDPNTGAVTGTPTAVGQSLVVFAATNATGQGLGNEVVFRIAPALTTPVVTSNGTAAGQVGQPFQFVITATNTPTAFGATGLPDGLTLTGAVISGIPTTATTTPITVTLTATNASGTSNPKPLLLGIAPAPATPLITSALIANGRVGTAFTYQMNASEGPTSFVAQPLPPGLSLNATGAITGTPTQSDTFSVILRAANPAGLGAPSTLTLNVAPAPLAPAVTSAAAVAGKVGVAFTYTITALPGPITGFGLTGTLPLGLSVNTSTGIISGQPAESGVFTVQLTATGDGGTSLPQPLVMNIRPPDGVPVITSPNFAPATVGANFTYQITAIIMPGATAFPASPFPATHALDAVNLPDGLAVNPSTGLIQGVPTATGTFTATLFGTSAAGNGPMRDLVIVIQPAPTAPVVTGGSQTPAQVGVPFSYQITAINNPTSYEVVGAPAWMTVDSQTGALAGTPTTPGLWTVFLLASNIAGTSGPKLFTIAIAAAAGTPVITSSRTAGGTVGTAFSYQMSASATPTSYVVTGLPAGLSLNSTTGLISGTPAASGTFPVSLSANNAIGSGAPSFLVLTIATSVQLVAPGS